MAAKVKVVTGKMKAQIVKAARALGGIAPDFSEGGGKTYEAWVLLELATRVRPEVTVLAQDHTGAATTSFRIRGGPGYLPKAGSKALEPCHFHLSGPGRNAELHSSLRHRGASGDTHELDISAVDPERAEAIRQHNGGPFDGAPFGQATLMGLELKEYDGVHSLPKVYARALLGVAVDLQPYLNVVVERRQGGQVHVLGGTDFWLVTTTTIGSSDRLLDHHDIKWRERVEPGPHQNRLQALADRLKQRLV